VEFITQTHSFNLEWVLLQLFLENLWHHPERNNLIEIVFSLGGLHRLQGVALGHIPGGQTSLNEVVHFVVNFVCHFEIPFLLLLVLLGFFFEMLADVEPLLIKGLQLFLVLDVDA